MVTHGLTEVRMAMEAHFMGLEDGSVDLTGSWSGEGGIRRPAPYNERSGTADVVRLVSGNPGVGDGKGSVTAASEVVDMVGGQVGHNRFDISGTELGYRM